MKRNTRAVGGLPVALVRIRCLPDIFGSSYLRTSIGDERRADFIKVVGRHEKALSAEGKRFLTGARIE
jgi:hypothetical protein